MHKKSIKRRIRRTYTLWQSFLRVLRYRLVVPMKRANRPPEYTARATAVGLFCAFNPFVGIQMYLCFLVWGFSKKVLKKDFSLPIACAWTWVTNVFTIIPVDYAFFVTGKLMMGERKFYSYNYFFKSFSEIFTEDMSLLDNVKATFGLMVQDWGSAIIFGSIPWMVLGAVLGYFLSYKYALRRYMKKQIKLAKALDKTHEKEYKEQKRKAMEAKAAEDNEFTR